MTHVVLPFLPDRRRGGLCVVEWGIVKEREFWQLLEEVFGRVYGRSLSRDQHLPKLHGMTAVEALASGEEPRVVWNVLCDEMDVSDARRWGRDHVAPPMPAYGRREDYWLRHAEH